MKLLAEFQQSYSQTATGLGIPEIWRCTANKQEWEAEKGGSKNQGLLVGSPCNKDQTIFGFVSAPLSFGNSQKNLVELPDDGASVGFRDLLALKPGWWNW